MTHLKPMALGLACGILWAAGVALIGILAATTLYWQEGVTVIGSFYLGFSTTTAGILIGTAWAFIDGFICGVLLAWLYNAFAQRTD